VCSNIGCSVTVWRYWHPYFPSDGWRKVVCAPFSLLSLSLAVCASWAQECTARIVVLCAPFPVFVIDLCTAVGSPAPGLEGAWLRGSAIPRRIYF
jgi:hypothetical protein